MNNGMPRKSVILFNLQNVTCLGLADSHHVINSFKILTFLITKEQRGMAYQ